MAPTVRQVTGWILHRPESLDPAEQDRLKQVLAHCPQLDAAALHVTGFAEMMGARHGDQLDNWLTGVEAAELPAPRAVVAGHKNSELPDDPAVIDQTPAYLTDVIEILATGPTARERYDRMLERHPDRLNPGPLWYGALGLLGD